MKNRLLLFVFLSFCLAANAQIKSTDKELISVEPDKELSNDQYNRWSFEVGMGQSRGIRPYTVGSATDNAEKYLGRWELNSYDFGVRYMVNPTFGFKVAVNYSRFTPDTTITAFKMHQLRFGFEGVINAVRLLHLEKQAGRFGFLLHGGVQFSALLPKKRNFSNPATTGETHYNGGLVVGFTPQFRLGPKWAITADITLLKNYRQQYDGDHSIPKAKAVIGSTVWATGEGVSTTVGVSYSFGRQKIHGDWAIVKDEKELKIDALTNQVGELQEMMNDTDEDGVPDYLDREQNSIAGAAVDIRGRTIDKNNNGIPDDVEKYIIDTVGSNGSTVNNNNSANNKRTEKSAVDFFQRLPATGLPVRLNEYFDKKATLEDCRKKIINVIVNDLKVAPENYRYFAIGTDSFGIVTSNDCITPNGRPFDANSCLKQKCFFKNFFCHHEGYSQMFVFLVVKKELGMRNFDITDAVTERMFNDDELQNIPNNIPILLEGEKVSAKGYSITVKQVEFYMEAKFSDPAIKKEATYDFKNRIKSFFKH